MPDTKSIPLATERRASARSPASCRKLVILLVEDHVDLAAALRKLLELKGHVVNVSGTMSGALKLAAISKPDLLISDLGLPDGSGLELMAQLRQRYPIQGICLSGRGLDEDIQLSKDAGFSAHLPKPPDMDKLERLIHQFAV